MVENIILLINAISLPVFIQDLEGRYLECNDRFAMYLNKTKSEIIGKHISDIVADNELATKAKELNDLLMKKSKLAKGQAG